MAEITAMSLGRDSWTAGDNDGGGVTAARRDCRRYVHRAAAKGTSAEGLANTLSVRCGELIVFRQIQCSF